ncbi:MAG: DUF6048 family protein [Bacteroidaceae bacterium]|nr:DUF6048 family protein [Bacteroidaceae bacterium]
MKISKFSSMLRLNSQATIFAFLAFIATNAHGQTLKGVNAEGKTITIDSTLVETKNKEKPTKWIPTVSDVKPPLLLFQGFTLSVDLLGAGMRAVSDYGNLEAALRLNLKNTYFPIAEAGYANCDIIDDNTSVHYQTKAPYMRIGFDYNILKDKYQDNRLFTGLRYGISKFSYDMAGPTMTDPIWGGSSDFDLTGIDCTSHWLEVCFGCQVKIWGSFHMGWSIRFKRELSSTNNDYAKPYYIPGYGTTVNSSCWGGTYNLIFDLNWGKKPKRK